MSPRLAFVTGGLPFGGSSTFLCNIGAELVRRKLPVLILSLEKYNAFESDFAALSVPLITYDDTRCIFEDRLRDALQALKEFQPTAVIGCLGPSSYEPLRYVPKGITRAAVIQSDDEMFYRSISPYGPFTEAAVGVSEQARSVLASMPEFRHARALYLPYGINIPPAFVPRRSKSDSPLRILYFGRLDRPQKRVQLFPEILRHLIESGISFLWTVAGQGEEAAFLEQNMKANRPGQEVRLRGGIPYADVPKLLQENDVFLLASNKEGLPLSLLEAMADGMVPVVTDMPSGIREVVSEGNGIKVPMDNVAGFAEAMVRLQRNPDEMERLSRSARETVAREFSTQAMTDRWLAAFPASNQHADWPERWKIRAPLSMPRPMYFSPPMRILRRLALRLRLRART